MAERGFVARSSTTTRPLAPSSEFARDLLTKSSMWLVWVTPRRPSKNHKGVRGSRYFRSFHANLCGSATLPVNSFSLWLPFHLKSHLSPRPLASRNEDCCTYNTEILKRRGFSIENAEANLQRTTKHRQKNVDLFSADRDPRRLAKLNWPWTPLWCDGFVANGQPQH